jgi:hypothetical protein
MPVTIQVDGATQIFIAAPNNGSLEELGYTTDGCQIVENIFTTEVHSDEFGGESGPPADIQYLGEYHIVRLNLSKYDEAVANKIRASTAGGTAGTPATRGTLYRQDTKSWRLLIKTPNRPRNYLSVVFREPREFNKGTKFSQLRVEAHCFESTAPTPGVVGGVLYNTTTS